MTDTFTNPVWGNVLRGVAIGDAWGNPNEFYGIGQLTARDRRGVDAPEFLEVTDDTQMTLYLARALNGAAGQPTAVTQKSIGEQFLAYLHDPDFAGRAPGVTVTNSLRRLERGVSWQDATDTYSDGCGTVMRVTPAAFAPGYVGVAAFSAAITHGTANGIAAAILNAELIQVAKNSGTRVAGHLSEIALDMSRRPADYGLLDTGDWLDGFPVALDAGFDALAQRFVTTTAALYGGYADDPWQFDPCIAGGEGWRAHECLATAVLCVDAFPHDAWQALRRAVNTNGDSDSIGAVAGGLLGALHGEFWPDGTLDRLEPRYQAEIAEAAQFCFI